MSDIDKAEKEIQQIIKKYGLKIGQEFDFPKYKILPDEVILPNKILMNHGMKIIFSLVKK